MVIDPLHAVLFKKCRNVFTMGSVAGWLNSTLQLCTQTLVLQLVKYYVVLEYNYETCIPAT